MDHSISPLCRGPGKADEYSLHVACDCPKFELERSVFLYLEEEFGEKDGSK
ncbi:Hypothetical protein FKW44_005327, partial [Caligus rogercresseyi]